MCDFRSRCASSQSLGSVMPELSFRLEAVGESEPLAFRVLVPLGRFRKARQALLLRHLGSLSSRMAFTYFSSACRRSSVRDSLLTVFHIQLFAGSGAGGGEPVWDCSSACRLVKSV